MQAGMERLENRDDLHKARARGIFLRAHHDAGALRASPGRQSK
jgi:hypothetical protein